ncbi:MAG TPA: hypothetical protein VHM70_28410 [Polyangiaceae bacterium]|jgi:hypothetical protein|nr:hypothetical protein [Polyangiaceae bacterium]
MAGAHRQQFTDEDARISRESLISLNPRRLIKLIGEQNGITAAEIASTFGYAPGSLMWVVRLLAAHHIVVTEAFPTSTSPLSLNYPSNQAVEMAQANGIELDLPLSR